MRSFIYFVLCSVLILPFFHNANTAFAEDRAGAVIAPFQQEELEKYRDKKSDDADQWKHEILFFMGVALLVLIFVTAGFGMSMALRGKEVFVQHMVSAGLTVFLALAHSVTAIVWFYPF